jgi:hypothetical protein
MNAAVSSANAPIVVINPNSVEAVTQGIEDAIVEPAALARLALPA